MKSMLRCRVHSFAPAPVSSVPGRPETGHPRAGGEHGVAVAVISARDGEIRPARRGPAGYGSFRW